MKNSLQIALCGLLLSTTFLSSCKKGEDDPFFSLRSRKARIAGEWNVTKMQYNESSVSNNTTETSTITYDGTTETTVDTYTTMGSTITTTQTDTYTEQYTFEKDGTYTYVRNYGSGTVTVEGTWIFLGKSKENELKKKEAILLTETKYTTSNNTVAYTGINDGRVITIRELRNKTMVWHSTYSESSNGNTDEGELTIKLEQD
ncbi:MAG TPA: hypothetical protein VK151_00295 [Fluviicola sp.]|nr:hypothetical protein [Fluviicola sp.]